MGDLSEETSSANISCDVQLRSALFLCSKYHLLLESLSLLSYLVFYTSSQKSGDFLVFMILLCVHDYSLNV